MSSVSSSLQGAVPHSKDDKEITAEDLNIDKTELIVTEQYQNLPTHPLETYKGYLWGWDFGYLTSLIWKGYKKPLESQDIWRLPRVDESRNLLEKFKMHYKVALHDGSNRPVLKALVAMFWKKFLIASIMKLWFDICNLLNPIILKFLLEFLTKVSDPNQNPNWWEGLIWILAMMFLQANAIFFTQQYFHIVLRIGMNMRSILSVAVYRKSLKLTTSVRSRMTVGKITNLMSVDTQKVADIMHFLSMVYSAPLQIIWCLVALSFLLYWPTAAGVAVMIFLIPLQMWIFRAYAKLRRQSLIFTDSRMKALNEVFRGIRIIKLFTYESEYFQKISGIRKREIVKIGKMNLARSFVGTLMSASPLMVSVSSFTLFAIAYPNRLTAEVIFPCLSYFMLLRFPMVVLPMVASSLVDANISLKRIETFFQEEERKPIKIVETKDTAVHPIQFHDCNFEWDVVEHVKDEVVQKKRKLLGFIPLPGRRGKKKGAIKMTESSDDLPEDDAVESGEEEIDNDVTLDDEGLPEHVPIRIADPAIKDRSAADVAADRSIAKLTDINLEVKKGELVAIIGSVGSGKSSLLSALVGEMKQTSGEVLIGSTMSYAPQTAWIMNATVRDNIIFYQPFDEAKLERIIDVCALRPDIEIFDNGVLSMLGENGVNTSGGQKQRINIARACYADSDIVVLDDVLSAVDTHVAKHIFEECILSYLKDKTRLLVTHHIHLCERCDRIVVMHQGRIAEVGSYNELMALGNGRFRALSDKYLSKTDEKEEVKEEEDAESKPIEEATKTVAATENKVKDMMRKDERLTGSVSWRLVLSYLNLMGGPLVVFFIMVFFVVTQIALVSSDWWLGEWSNRTFGINNSVAASLAIYAGLGVFATVITLIRDWSFFLAGLLASYRLHNNALKRIFRAPMSFFETTPLGAILSRMSKDVEQADSQIIVALNSFLSTLCSVVASVAMVAYVTRGVYLILVVIILPLYVLVQQLYRRTSRELKRLDSISRSPLYAHFAETLNGISTIRAYKKEAAFQQVNADRMDLNQRPYFTQLIAQRWLAFRLESLGAILVGGASAAVMGLSYVPWFGVSASRAGLGIVYSMTLTNVMSWCVRQFVEAETQFNAVERLIYYAKNVPNERKALESKRPPRDWPRGRIEFKDYCMRYRPELPLVLKNVNLRIEQNCKVGVVGRTGSGKSSLTVALFRLVEPASGAIFIDDVDIGSIGLNDVRGAISCIPQDPVLFSGSIRSNLDPFHKNSDAQIWAALDKAAMKDTIESMGGLTTAVNEGGENFSVGQRQLLCLARALLKKSNILVMDEASASIDVENDAILQRTIREEFKTNCTVITIAHRLLSIADSDYILVMDQGRVAEYAPPAELLRDEKSIFYSMVMQTGKAASKNLFDVVFGGKNVVDTVMAEAHDTEAQSNGNEENSQ